MSKDFSVLSIYVPVSLRGSLDAAASAHGCSRSAFVKTLLERELSADGGGLPSRIDRQLFISSSRSTPSSNIIRNPKSAAPSTPPSRRAGDGRLRPQRRPACVALAWIRFSAAVSSGATVAAFALGPALALYWWIAQRVGRSASVRDAVTLTQRRNLEPLVLPDEIMDLPSLSGFLKYPEGFPAARVTLRIVDYPVIAEGFVQRPPEPDAVWQDGRPTLPPPPPPTASDGGGAGDGGAGPAIVTSLRVRILGSARRSRNSLRHPALLTPSCGGLAPTAERSE